MLRGDLLNRVSGSEQLLRRWVSHCIIWTLPRILYILYCMCLRVAVIINSCVYLYIWMCVILRRSVTGREEQFERRTFETLLRMLTGLEDLCEANLMTRFTACAKKLLWLQKAVVLAIQWNFTAAAHFCGLLIWMVWTVWWSDLHVQQGQYMEYVF